MVGEPVASSTVLAFTGDDETTAPAISWSAVIAGALITAAIALILLALGAGFGLAMASPWVMGGSATALGATAVIWIIVMQIVASSLGGYLAGRLRSTFTHVHRDEVYFRDTAQGFLAWGLGVIITVSLLASAAASVMGAATRAADALPSAAPSTTAAPGGYYVDLLFQSARTEDTTDGSARAEASRLLTHWLEVPADEATDNAALSQLVTARTGLSGRDASSRVADVEGRLRQSADQARRTAEHAAFWTFIALLVGALCASWTATIGGRHRDKAAAAGSTTAR